ncbi:MAG: hypothetical protein IJ242_02635 [Clostridia bacterium]|nr:hypothetical protein [Clostridia bacterium]
MALVKQDVKNSVSYNKTNDTYYVYEVTYYVDNETGKKVKKRRVIGKQDPVTHETIPTRGYRTNKESTKEPLKNDSTANAYFQTALQEAQKQFEFDRNAKIQLTSALVRSSEQLESIIRQSSDELKSIKSVLSRFGMNA